jgi:hypothetical protein
MRFGPALLLLLPLLAACVAVPPSSQPGQSGPPIVRPPVTGIPPTRPVTPPRTGFLTPQVHRAPGLEGVIEQDATHLTRLFGQPRLDVREGDARKLQFAGQACVLDVFLYPLRPGAEPVATYVEARRASDGAEVDRAACAQALRR